MAELRSILFPTQGTRITYVTKTFYFNGSLDAASGVDAIGILYHSIIPSVHQFISPQTYAQTDLII